MGEAAMIRYKYEDSFNLLKKYESLINYTINHVTDANADWYLFQMIRDAQFFKNIIDKGLDGNSLERKNYNYNERDIFSLLMEAYIHFLLNREKDIETDKKRLLREVYEIQKELSVNLKLKHKFNLEKKQIEITSKFESVNFSVKDFVDSVVDTRILVEDSTVKIFTNNEELLFLLKEIVLKNNLKFKQIRKIEETYSWWAQTTKGS